jgi:DNA-nicking Smr family endonuclease
LSSWLPDAAIREKDQIEMKKDKDHKSSPTELGADHGQNSPVEIPVNGVLDLHTFQPKEVKELVSDYIEECLKREIYALRIIHGKGTGTLKAIVHSVLKKHPAVLSFKDADLIAGGWGATEVFLKKR